ncbi:MAG: hypothetical protein PHT33_12820 [bacterium]|nr:hypothetical protein [bacterium]
MENRVRQIETEIFPLQIATIGIEGAGPRMEYGRWVDLDREFIEVKSRCSYPLDITRWLLRMVQRIGIMDEYYFPSLVLEPHATVKIRSGRGDDCGTDIYMNRDIPIWVNPDTCYEIISVRNRQNDIVDIRRNPLSKLYPFDGNKENYFILDERGDPGTVNINPQLGEFYGKRIRRIFKRDGDPRE